MSPLPLISPPQEAPTELPIHDWQGPYGAPNENNRIPVYPPLDGTSFLTTIDNLVQNPSFEVDLQGWVNDFGTGGGVTRTRDTTVFDTGIASQKIVTAGTASVEGVRYGAAPLLALQPLTQYLVQVRAAGSGTPQLLLDEYNASTVFVATTSKSLTLTASWQTFTLLVTTSATTASGRLSIRTAAAAAITFWIDSVSLIAGAIPHSFFDGSRSEAWWLGTPHLSISRKAVSPFNDPPNASWYIQNVATDFTTYPTT